MQLSMDSSGKHTESSSQLAQRENSQASVHIVIAISDLERHMRKCMQCAIETSEYDDGRSDSALHSVLEACLLLLTEKVYFSIYEQLKSIFSLNGLWGFEQTQYDKT